MEEDPSVFDYDEVYDEMKEKIACRKVQDRTDRKIEEQHKKAMEEDPSVFDYDGVYDEIKGKITRPKVQDRTERKTNRRFYGNKSEKSRNLPKESRRNSPSGSSQVQKFAGSPQGRIWYIEEQHKKAIKEDPSVIECDEVYDEMKGKIARPKVQDRTEIKIEEQHKKAMEEDPSVFDYDGVYDEMKGKIAHPKVQDRMERTIEEQHKKAIKEDPSVIDCDGVYDEMKGKIACPKVQDRTERKVFGVGS
ncbi:uncharacterized protein LOC135644255 [Musa acuminata AAA Group]|uniref:uncharacterized protein LOC135644255 n=1 Tax=Musa acuminata AAA Group TaxID=214697 RepID=UPI0031D02E2C